MKQFINPVHWYDMLTLDHTTCRICYTEPHQPDSLPSMRQLAEAEGKPLKGDRVHHQAAYKTSLRAALRRHIAKQHPEWAGNVRWHA